MSDDQQTSKKAKTADSKDKDSRPEKDDKRSAAAPASSAAPMSLDDSNSEMVTLVSQEKTSFRVPKKAALQSHLVRTALEDDKDAKEVPLVHIAAPIVEKCIQYMTYHVDVPPRKIESPLKSSNMKELVDRFDAKFVDDIDLDTLMKLLLAANYMDIKSLLELICAKVASMMKGKTAPQIRKAFNIREEFTPEEYEEIKEKFPELLPIELPEKKDTATTATTTSTSAADDKKEKK